MNINIRVLFAAEGNRLAESEPENAGGGIE